ncbi:amylase-binding adhesin AbpA [Streptococcus cristatus]|uniref:amylase-binding adhesin AbpA n=1 Tax=Streptococcus cristatus TaxID=45634 RepID=UPI0039C205AD
MKKVVLSSVVALSLFALAVPAFAQGENAESSNQLTQKKYVSERDVADEANTQVAAHDGDIRSYVTSPSKYDSDADVQAAKAAYAAAQAQLDAYGSGHEYGAYKEKADAAFNNAYTVLRNKYVADTQKTFRNGSKTQGNYWNDPTGVEDNKPNDLRIKEDQERQGQAGQAGQNVKPGANAQNPASAAEAARTESKAGKDAKAGQKAAGKALPKTSAVK